MYKPLGESLKKFIWESLAKSVEESHKNLLKKSVKKILRNSSTPLPREIATEVPWESREDYFEELLGGIVQRITEGIPRPRENSGWITDGTSRGIY